MKLGRLSALQLDALTVGLVSWDSRTETAGLAGGPEVGAIEGIGSGACAGRAGLGLEVGAGVGANAFSTSAGVAPTVGLVSWDSRTEAAGFLGGLKVGAIKGIDSGACVGRAGLGLGVGVGAEATAFSTSAGVAPTAGLVSWDSCTETAGLPGGPEVDAVEGSGACVGRAWSSMVGAEADGAVGSAVGDADAAWPASGVRAAVRGGDAPGLYSEGMATCVSCDSTAHVNMLGVPGAGATDAALQDVVLAMGGCDGGALLGVAGAGLGGNGSRIGTG